MGVGGAVDLDCSTCDPDKRRRALLGELQGFRDVIQLNKRETHSNRVSARMKPPPQTRVATTLKIKLQSFPHYRSIIPRSVIEDYLELKFGIVDYNSGFVLGIIQAHRARDHRSISVSFILSVDTTGEPVFLLQISNTCLAFRV